MRRLPALASLVLLLCAGAAQATVSLPVPWKQGMCLKR